MENKFKRIVSFARKRVRNKARENKIIEDQFPKFQVNVNEDGIKAINEIFPQKFNSYILEIGFGSGENIIAQALDNPNQAFIGCEVYTSGVMMLWILLICFLIIH
jgi:tRNA (guanine-N7-)-methyltransferase